MKPIEVDTAKQAIQELVMDEKLRIEGLPEIQSEVRLEKLRFIPSRHAISSKWSILTNSMRLARTISRTQFELPDCIVGVTGGVLNDTSTDAAR